MPASARLRRRRARLGAAVGAVLVLVAAATLFVAVSTLRDSEVGQAIRSDERPVAVFPSTPVVAFGVVDDADRLTSLVVTVLSPSGRGGSLVTVPVDADTSLGLLEDPTPLNSRPYAPGEQESAFALASGLESLLSLTVTEAVVLDAAAVTELVAPFAPLRVEFAEDVVDVDSDPSVVAEAGATTLGAERAAAVLTAIDLDGTSYSHHPNDVAVWAAFADAVSASPSTARVPTDSFGRPLDPVDVDEFVARLTSGEVRARDLRLSDSDGPAGGGDGVVLDRSDALLVFAEIAPALVSTPNESLSFQIVAPFTAEQIDAVLTDATKPGVLADLVGELLFSQGNVISVLSQPAPEGADSVTRLEVSDERFVETVRSVAPILFGDVEVVVATRLIDGVDVVATLGTDFLERRAEIRAETGDDDADRLDESGTDASGGDDGGTDAGGEAVDAEVVPTDAEDGAGATSDTVLTDD